jgi:hypothetical protein
MLELCFGWSRCWLGVQLLVYRGRRQLLLLPQQPAAAAAAAAAVTCVLRL